MTIHKRHQAYDYLETLDFGFTPECEHFQHELDIWRHDDGPARWFVHGGTAECGHAWNAAYVCQEWKDYCEKPGSRAKCRTCDQSHETNHTFTPISPDGPSAS